MAKKAIEVRKDEKEPIKSKPVSARKKEYENLIEAYKKQNPAKYELKKEVLEERLKNIK